MTTSYDVAINGYSSTRGVQMNPEHLFHLQMEKAARRIQTWWASVKNKRIFSVFKSAICCAEGSVTHEILRKLIPREAYLLQDPTVQPKIRFRLKGDSFPPVIVFKIFTECNSIKYISGKSMIRPTSEASEDARRQMGNRIYFDQMLQDACQHHQLHITDVIDIATVKDFMKYKSGLDESPAYLGGRENYWRNLTLDVLPRHTMMYNLMEILLDTSQVRKHLPIEKLEEVNTTHLNAEDKVIRIPSSSVRSNSVASGKTKKNKAKVLKGSKSIAKMRADKMRKNYSFHQFEDIENDFDQSNQDHVPYELLQQQHQDGQDSTDQTLDDETQAIELYEWTQDLSFEELK